MLSLIMQMIIDAESCVFYCYAGCCFSQCHGTARKECRLIAAKTCFFSIKMDNMTQHIDIKMPSLIIKMIVDVESCVFYSNAKCHYAGCHNSECCGPARKECRPLAPKTCFYSILTIGIKMNNMTQHNDTRCRVP